MATKAKSTTTPEVVSVTPDNFNRAETDINLGFTAKDGALGKMKHQRELVSINHPVVRPNRDTLYSMSVFDLDAGPVTVTMPDAKDRFMSLQEITEDHYSQTYYGSGSRTFARDKNDARYVGLGVRTLVDPNDPADVTKVHALQDAIVVDQPGGPGKWEVPNWDMESRNKVRNALLVLSECLTDSSRMFGLRDEVDPMRHLIGTAMGWGGNAQKDALYLPVTPQKNDGTTVYKLTVPGNVPVDGFWSISLYNADGRFVKNDLDAYSLNNITAKKDADGSVTIQFGACDGKTANCLPIMPGWNYLVRLYRPRKEVLDGTYKFPEARPLS